jgi:imidazolonepropionase-like amidohydrolase
MKEQIVGIFVLLALALSPAFVQDSQTLILEHANVVDPLSDQPLHDQTIVLSSGRIQRISSSPATMAGERIDLKGAWVLPGLIDAHIHPMGIAGARRMLSLGVTTGRSMFSWNYTDVGLRILHKRGDVDIPTILASGYPIVASPVKFVPDITALFLDNPSLDDLRNRDRGVYFVPTLSPFSFELSSNAPPEAKALRPRNEKMFDCGRQAVLTARRLGVPVVAGADTSYDKGETTVIDEIIELASAGLSNLEAIRSATTTAAACLKISAAKGALKPGMDADLVVYLDNPVNDLTLLRNPILIINNGKVFLNKLPSSQNR